MTPGEALLEVQGALRARRLPGGVGLRERDRCFIVQLAPGDLGARPAVAELLTAMGCETSINGHGTVYGKLTGRLRPAPPLPPVHVSSSDSGRAAELAAVTAAKRCNGPCGQVLPLDSFSLNGRSPLGKQRRMHVCKPCDAARQARGYAARAAAIGDLDSGA